jgi:hypothetical protein
MKKYYNEGTPSEQRRKRTRTLIQVGGLLEKANLLHHFGIKPGDNLQEDPELQESTAELFGALLEIKTTIENNEHSPALWQQIGKKGLKD